MNVSLTPKLEKLVQAKIKSGRYNNASEVIREALRLLEESDEIRKLKLRRLRKALAAGEADLAAGRVTAIADDRELEAYFGRL